MSVMLLFSSLLLVCVSNNSHAQYVKHWAGMDKLSSESVEDVVQGPSGFLWFATNGGLSRFDGYKFEKFTTSNLPGLQSNEIKALCIDHLNRLWVGTTENGVCILDLSTYKIIKKFTHIGGSGELKSNKVTEIKMDKNSAIWVSTEDGYLHKFDGVNSFTTIQNSFETDSRFGFYPRMTSDDRFLYLYTINRGIYKIDLKSNKVVANFGKELYPHSGMIENIDGVGIVFCAKEGAMKIDPLQDTFNQKFTAVGAEMFSALKDKNGTFWFVQNDRKSIQLMKDGVVRDLTALLFAESDNVHVSKIYNDASNNVWICTTNGVYKVTNDNLFFSNILGLNQWKGENYIPSFRGMLEDEEGTVFFGGYSGLFKKEKDGTIVQLFDNKIPYTPYVLIDRNKNELWALCEGYGVILVNKTTGAIEQFEDEFSKIDGYKGIYLVSGAIAKDGKFWLGSYEGMLRFDPVKKKYTTQKLMFNKHPIHEYKARQIFKTQDDHIWICTNYGVFVLDPRNKPIAHYHTKGKGKFFIPFNDVNCIEETSDGKIWIGSRTNGAFQIGSAKDKVLNSKLANNSIASILEDKFHNIWLATNEGLTRFDVKSGEVINYFVENGLSSNEFNHGSALRTRKGELYFGGVNGINVYNSMNKVNHKVRQNRIVLSRIEIPSSEGELQIFYCGAELKNGISLPYNNANLYLEFFLTDFTRSESNSYEYFIEGYSKEWISLKNQNFLRIVGLSAGDYTLRIRGADFSGRLCKDELVIPIHVEEIFYKTWWFVMLNSLLIIGGIGYVFYARFRRQLALSEMRVALASDLHDDIGSTLTKIAMQSEMLEEEVDQKQRNSLKTMSFDARKAMSSMRDMVWSIDTRNSNMDSLFDKINEYVQKTVGDLEIPYELTNDPALKNMNLTPIQKKEIYYIVKEAINNALKHGDGSRIEIELQKSESNFVLTISNGCAAVPSASNTGSGLKNMQMRAERIGAKISFRKEIHFTLQMKLPLKKTFLFL